MNRTSHTQFWRNKKINFNRRIYYSNLLKINALCIAFKAIEWAGYQHILNLVSYVNPCISENKLKFYLHRKKLAANMELVIWVRHSSLPWHGEIQTPERTFYFKHVVSLRTLKGIVDVVVIRVIIVIVGHVVKIEIIKTFYKSLLPLEKVNV